MIFPVVCRTVRATDLAPPSLVCKVSEVEGRPAVKLSGNPDKFLVPKDEITRYEQVFWYSRGVARPA